MIIAGCDESGRGCVFGSLVIAAFSCSADAEGELRRMGVRDSKLVAPEKRFPLYEKLLKKGDFVFDVLTAEFLTEQMRKKVSLNEIEARSVSALLKKLREKSAFSRAYVDSPDPVPQKFEKRIRKYFDHEFDLVCRNKADRDFPVVGAASIIAKTIREKELDDVKEILRKKGLDGEIGTGYSHDERAINFLKAHWKNEELKPFVRWEWKTAKNVQAHQVDLKEFF